MAHFKTVSKAFRRQNCLKKTCPPRSPDLTYSDFWWAIRGSHVHQETPGVIEQLKVNTQKMPLAVTWRDFVPLNVRIFVTVVTHVLTARENILNVFLKGKFHPTTGHEGPQAGVETCFYSFFNLDARWARAVNTTTTALYHRERIPATLVQKAVWAPEPVIRCRKSRPHRDSTPEYSSSQPVAILTALSRPEYILVALIYVVIFSEI